MTRSAKSHSRGMPLKTVTKDQPTEIKGVHAVLGVDVVSFSTLSDDDQIKAIAYLLEIVGQSLSGEGITERDYRWSPAGDGGYLTFQTREACIKAIDVAFSIWDKFEHPRWTPVEGEKLRLRFALHAGLVEESPELGGNTNIWGDGINKAARILAISANSQILVSDEYYKTYIKGRREEQGFEFGDIYHRTVKHGVDVSLMNVSRKGSGINEQRAKALRWERIGTVWQKVMEDYEFLIRDAMNSGDVIAALAASKFLLNLDADSPAAQKLFSMISTGRGKSSDYRPHHHPVFSAMPPDVIKKLIQQSAPRKFTKGEPICMEGDVAKSCYFLAYGLIEVEGTNISEPILISPGQILGEFALWIPDTRRTANLKAAEDCLVLEVSTALFQSIMDDYPNLAKGIYGTIQHRILENMSNSAELFPDLSAEQRQDLAKKPSGCEKYPKGTKLDLRNKTYILFSGKVSVPPPKFNPFEITTNGHFGPETIIGVASHQGPIDGNEANVIEDSVAVHFPREKLLRLQSESEALARAWDGIWGQRRGLLHRRR